VAAPADPSIPDDVTRATPCPRHHETPTLMMDGHLAIGERVVVLGLGVGPAPTALLSATR
jgi:hypothetical protein